MVMVMDVDVDVDVYYRYDRVIDMGYGDGYGS